MRVYCCELLCSLLSCVNMDIVLHFLQCLLVLAFLGRTLCVHGREKNAPLSPEKSETSVSRVVRMQLWEISGWGWGLEGSKVFKCGVCKPEIKSMLQSGFGLVPFLYC